MLLKGLPGTCTLLTTTWNLYPTNKTAWDFVVLTGLLELYATNRTPWDLYTTNRSAWELYATNIIACDSTLLTRLTGLRY